MILASATEHEHRQWVRRRARELEGLPPEEEPDGPQYKMPEWLKDHCTKCAARGVFVRTALMCPNGHGFIGGI